jgi:hypothetical protein
MTDGCSLDGLQAEELALSCDREAVTVLNQDPRICGIGPDDRAERSYSMGKYTGCDELVDVAARLTSDFRASEEYVAGNVRFEHPVRKAIRDFFRKGYF